MTRRLIAAAVLITLVFTSAAILITSERGSRALIRWGLTLGPETLAVEQISGRLSDTVLLSGIRYHDQGWTVTAKRLRLSWQPSALWQGLIHIRQLQLDGARIELPSWEPPPELRRLNFRLPLPLRCDDLTIARAELVRGDRSQVIQHLKLALSARDQRLSIEALKLAAAPLDLQGSGGIAFTPGMPVNFRSQWQLEPPDRGRWAGASMLSGTLAALRIENTLTAPFAAKVNGDLQLHSNLPRFQLEGGWQNLNWPLPPAPASFQSPQGHFTLNGNLDHYQLTVQAGLEHAPQPPAQIEIIAGGNRQSLTFESLRLLTDAGHLQLQGTVAWSRPSTLDLDLEATAAGFDPALLVNQLPGRLMLQSRIQGRFADDRFEGMLQLQRLSGQLRGYPIGGSGRFKVAGERLEAHALHLQSGPNNLNLNGTLDSRGADLTFSLAAPDLATLWPDLAGQIDGHGRIQGAWTNPDMVVRLQAHSLAFGDAGADRLAAEIDYHPNASSQSQVRLNAAGIAYLDQHIDTLTLNAEGSRQSHQARLNASAAGISLSAALAGTLQDSRWRASLHAAQLEQRDIGLWQLEAPAPLNITRRQGGYRIELGQSCLNQNQARLCLRASHTESGTLRFDSEATALPLQLARRLFPANLAATGQVDAKAWLQGHGKTLSAAADLRLAEGATLGLSDDPDERRITLGLSSLESHYQDGRLESRFQLALAQGDRLEGATNFGLEPQSPLAGHLRGRITALNLIDPWLPELAPIRGQLDSDLRWSGTLEQPQLSGTLQLLDGSAAVQPLGITLEAIELKARSEQPGQIILQGKANSGPGSLTLDGIAHLDPKTGWPLQLTLSGEEFQAVRLPQAEISLSPELKISATADQTRVTGILRVPQALVHLQQLPKNAVTPSADEVLVGAAPVRPRGPRLSNLEADVEVELGDNVRFEGHGLTTTLGGGVKVRQQGEKTSAVGAINLKNGRYHAYGQDLKLRSGRFLFNGPADNPWLNIVASRRSRSGKVTALLTLEGPLQSPQTRISSEPSLPEEEALAYLITGRSIDRLSQSDSDMMATAALAYGAEKVSWLTQKLGIDEFSIREGETLEDTLLTLGDQLTPQFYVGFSVGLFNQERRVVMRHSLTEHISVEAQSGESQRIELKYGIDVE